MIQWPSIPADNAAGSVAEPVMFPADAEGDVQAFPMPESPGAGSEQGAGKSPSIGPAHQASPPDSHLPGRRWRSSVAAMFLSVVAHAAVIYAVADYLAPHGFDAETDAVSAIIIVDSQPELAEQPAIAGDANETIEAGAPEEQPQESEQTTEIAAETTADEVISKDSSTDIVAEELLPQFSPLPPLTDMAVLAPDPIASEAELLRPVARSQAEIAVAPESSAAPELPVLATPPSIKAMLPDIPLPTPPSVTASSPPEQKVAETAPETSAKPLRPRSEARRTAEIQPKPIRNETRTAKQPKPRAREMTDRSKTAVAPVKPSKDKAQAASRAGAVASTKASAGEKENYGRKVNGHVQRFRRYPREAARKGIKGAVRVSISISNSGGLAAASVQASSGYPMLDKEALATVRRAAPYPRPPEGFDGVARFSLTLRFSK